MSCYLDKSFSIWDGHSREDIEGLIEIINIWLTTIKVVQKGNIDLFDINDIINYHWMIFHREYIHEKYKMGEQLNLMLNDIEKFSANYGKNTTTL